jgi:chromosome segregation ATPase
MEPVVTEEKKSTNQPLEQEKGLEVRVKSIDLNLVAQKMEIDHLKSRIKNQDEKSSLFMVRTDTLTRVSEANSHSLITINKKIKEMDAYVDSNKNTEKKITALEKKTQESLKNMEKVVDRTKNEFFNRISNYDKNSKKFEEEVKRLGGKFGEFEGKISENTEKFVETVKRIEGTLKGNDNRLGSLEEKVGSLEVKVDEKFGKLEEKFGKLEKKMDEKFRSLEEKMDEKFRSLEEKMDEKFGSLEEKVKRIDDCAKDVEVLKDNVSNITKNLNDMCQILNKLDHYVSGTSIIVGD